MSVLIEGMEMPKCCDACSFAYWSNLYQTGACDLLDGEQCFDEYSTDYRIKRSEHCPLIEVPEPHGRLISADKLIEFIENRYEITWKDDYEGGIKDACVDILEKISTMPPVIPASEEGKT